MLPASAIGFTSRIRLSIERIRLNAPMQTYTYHLRDNHQRLNAEASLQRGRLLVEVNTSEHVGLRVPSLPKKSLYGT